MDKSEKLGNRSIVSLLLEFSVPSIIGMIVTALYNVIDRIFIGNSIGALGITAITVAFPIMQLQMAFGGLVGMGATANISIKLGEGDKAGARKIAANAFSLLIIVSLLFTAFMLIFLDPLLRLFGASNEVLPYAREYMGIIVLGTVFQMIGFGLNNMIRAEGKPVTAMLTMLIGTVMNVILAPIFIFVLNMGMHGAALATVLSQVVSTTWILIHFLTGDNILKIQARNMKLKGDIVKVILSLGISNFVLQAANSFLTIVLNHGLAAYGGDIAISGIGIVNSLSTLMILPAIGINQGAQPIIGFNYGAKKYQRVRKTLLCAVIINTIITTAGFILTRLIPTQLIALFDSTDKELISFGTNALIIFLSCMPIVGFQITGSGYFLAVGKPKQSMILSLSRQILILIPLILILPKFFKLNGILYAGPISDAISAFITGFWLFVDLRSMKLKSSENERTENEKSDKGIEMCKVNTANTITQPD
ncbi:MATE efflux family protein [[Clostridium] cellulosi]|uniref:Multidrug export protein MepA n=1 Tax=[Clostridium] cellulosi TaxID=29343 RepID=A0A078KQ38_9FIRM|nr:MATE efflux family protein [[Clostridium] cellulosi]